jgi:hypothetical protein
VLFLNSREYVHGTSPVVRGPFARRIGTACVLSRHVLSAAKNALERGEGPYWGHEVAPTAWAHANICKSSF